MDIPSPAEIVLDGVTRELLADIHSLAEQIDEWRPLPDDVVEKIQSQLLGERVYNSNAIEGNTLTLRETTAVLASGGKIDVGKKREATEAINLGEAIEAVQKFVSDRNSWVDRQQFLSVHQILLKNWKDEAAGRIRTGRVMIAGAKHQPPRAEEIDGLLETFFGTLLDAKDVDSVVLAAWTHWCIARIHPFEDGNGRMARLWQDLVLFADQLTAAVIRQQHRKEYYEALAAADEEDFNPLIQVVAQSLSRTLQIYVNAHRQVDELKEWAETIVGETKARVDEKRKLEYLRWIRQMELARDAFERCATQITNASDGTVEVQVKPFDVIDQSTWESLRSGSRASFTWYFWVHARQGDLRARYCFFFGRHWMDESNEGLPEIGLSTSMLISEQRSTSEKAVRLDEIDDCPLRLRELLVVDGKLCQKRIDAESQSAVYDLDVDPLMVAREFLQDVFLHRLT